MLIKGTPKDAFETMLIFNATMLLQIRSWFRFLSEEDCRA